MTPGREEEWTLSVRAHERGRRRLRGGVRRARDRAHRLTCSRASRPRQRRYVSAGGPSSAASSSVAPRSCASSGAAPPSWRRSGSRRATPAATLAAVVAFFRAQVAAGRPVGALGDRLVRPVELRPRSPRWGSHHRDAEARLVGRRRAGPDRRRARRSRRLRHGRRRGGARRGSARCRGRGSATFVYLTVGTGIGGGAVVGGRDRPRPGARGDGPRLGAAREPGDDYPGLMPLPRRLPRGNGLRPRSRGAIRRAARDAARRVRGEAAELAAAATSPAGLRNIVYVLAPERIVIGGGVAELEGFVPLVRERLRLARRRYPGLPEHAADDFVVPAALGAHAGPIGALSPRRARRAPRPDRSTGPAASGD